MPAGREALRTWLSTKRRLDPEPERIMLPKLFFGANADRVACSASSRSDAKQREQPLPASYGVLTRRGRTTSTTGSMP